MYNCTLITNAGLTHNKQWKSGIVLNTNKASFNVLLNKTVVGP
jgi:hypothetical protein